MDCCLVALWKECYILNIEAEGPFSNTFLEIPYWNLIEFIVEIHTFCKKVVETADRKPHSTAQKVE